MTRRYELTAEQFRLIEDLLPRSGGRGGQWLDHRMILNGMLWILYSGAQWRELPERYGSWQTVYSRFRRWQRDGTLERILQRLHLQLDAEGRIDLDTWMVDATIIRANRSAAGAEKKIASW